MTRDIIKEATGKLLGSIDRTANGVERGYDSAGRLVGSYDPNNRITKSATGELLTKGNALSGLIL